MIRVFITTIALTFASNLFAAHRPNVIFMLTDDLGYSDVGGYEARKVKRPHIHQLAANGICFTDYHAAASICSALRAAFLTSLSFCGIARLVGGNIAHAVPQWEMVSLAVGGRIDGNAFFIRGLPELWGSVIGQTIIVIRNPLSGVRTVL